MSDAACHEPPGSCLQDSSLERPKKRQKIAIACDGCRARKVKCDGFRPVCGVCVRRKSSGLSGNCSYADAKEGTPIASRWLSQASEVHDPRPSSSHSRKDFLATAANFNVFEVQQSVDTVPDSVEESSKGVDSMTGAIIDPTNNAGFYGGSSAGSFTRQIKAAIDARIGVASRRPSFSGTVNATLFSLPRTMPQKTIDYVLPSRKVADGLMSVYWDRIYPLYPFLDPESFQKSYESVWTGSSPVADERMMVCTLNVVFALACQLSDSLRPENREEAAKVYFGRAQELLQVDLWDVGSAELIQRLLLMGQYLQSTSSPHQCWMVIGHAIRIAQSLGYHLPLLNSKYLSKKERQRSSIIWHGCVLMDRVLSMTFGRPAMIAKSFANAVPLPESETPDSVGSDEQQQNQPSRIAFFVESLRLYDIMNDILIELYTNHDHGSSGDAVTRQSDDNFLNLETILRLDQSLMLWGRSLPPYLRISSFESAQNTTCQMQSIVCRARFLHARILLLRPAISHFCLLEPRPSAPGTALDESLGHRMVVQCSSLCMRSAHDMIKLIYSNLSLDDLTGPLPAWWYCILYVYTAATVLLAARLHPILNADNNAYSISESWDHAIQVLKAFERLGPSAQRCVAALEILSAKVSKVDHNTTIPSALGEASLAFDECINAAGGNLDGISQEFDFNDIEIDMSDMSWLNILPGNLYSSV